MSTDHSFFGTLRTAGVNPGDSEELRLQKSLLIFATGLISFASMLWLFIYAQLGPQFSSTIPFIFQFLLIGNLVIYLKTRNFDAFRLTQLSIFLFLPFVAQWSMGNFITASGVSLWGLLAPVGAVLFIGPRESAAWFFAYLFLTALSGGFDYYLADTLMTTLPKVPTQTTIFFFALNFAAVSTIVYLLLRYSATEKQRAQACLEETFRMLQIEQDRSERLLLNILPGAIAERLKNSNQTIADGFADVTVMFADIVNFTKVAEGLTPQQVFTMLNKIFSSFDELAEKYGMEKIKTIGDAYMCVAGIPLSTADHVERAAHMALDMLDAVDSFNEQSAYKLQLRIGLDTGAGVAGVIGKRKFIYDLWGDTVNTANRMESQGVAGRIQVTEATRWRLHDPFIFEERGTIELKGKDPMNTWFLIGRSGGAAT